jgi:hypothetical protein
VNHFTATQFRSAWRWFIERLAPIGVILALLSMGTAIKLNQDQTASVREAQAHADEVNCLGQRRAAKQWDRTMTELEQLSAATREDGLPSPVILELGDRTRAIYNETPACRLATR